MYYLEKKIKDGDWFAVLKSDARNEIIEQLNILRQNELTVRDYTENTFYIPELDTKYRIIDKEKMDLISQQLGYTI